MALLIIPIQLYFGTRALLPPNIFRKRSIAAGSLTNFCIGGAYFSVIVSLPFILLRMPLTRNQTFVTYYYQVRGSSSLRSGVQLIPMSESSHRYLSLLKAKVVDQKSSVLFLEWPLVSLNVETSLFHLLMFHFFKRWSWCSKSWLRFSVSILWSFRLLHCIWSFNIVERILFDCNGKPHSPCQEGFAQWCSQWAGIS